MSKKEKQQTRKPDLTEEKLFELGFEKFNEPAEETGNDFDYHYFTYELYDKECLISNANDEADNGLYKITFFNMPSSGPYITEIEIKNIINAIKLNK